MIESGRATSSWPRVVVLVAVGVTAALHVGKVPPSLGVLRATLGIDSLTAGWLISLFAGIGALTGVVCGQFADRVGHRTVVIGGLVAMAVASAAGALCTTIGPLLVTRLAEGFGFLSVAVAMPPLIVSCVRARDRRLALGMWSAYMPLGIALGPAIAPLVLPRGGWPLMWMTCAVISAVAVVAVVLTVRATPVRAVATHVPLLAGIRAVLATRAPFTAGVAFGCYAATYFALVGFLPAIVVASGAPFTIAAEASAAVALINGGGNVLAGILARHASRVAIMTGGFAVVAVGGALYYLPSLPLWLRLVAVAIGVLAAGVVPATVTGSVVALAPRPDLISTTQGLAQQLSSVGQLIGPPLIAFVGASSGGASGAVVILCLTGTGIVATQLLGRMHVADERAIAS